MTTWETYLDPRIQKEAKDCPRCGKRPQFFKDSRELSFRLVCPSSCAAETAEIKLSRIVDDHPYELGYGYERAVVKLLEWWNGL